MIPIREAVIALWCCAVLATEFPGALAQAAQAEPAARNADERLLFDGKRAAGIVFSGAPWAQKPGCIEGSGVGNSLWSEAEIADGDFAITARLSLSNLNSLGAAFRIGDSAFVFDGERKAVACDGPLFGKQRLLQKPEQLLKAGKPFDFAIERAGGTLSVAIDGTPLVEAEVATGPLGRFGFTPTNAVIALYRWTARGALVAPQSAPQTAVMQSAIDAAIDRGVMFVLRRQQRDGSWSTLQVKHACGQTALAVYALVKAGLPKGHPAIVRALRYLDPLDPVDTYSAGLVVMAYGALGGKAAEAKQRTVVGHLLEWSRGAHWSYPHGWSDSEQSWTSELAEPDLSNTQYAVLGLRAGALAGIDIPAKTWLDVIDAVEHYQEPPYTVEVAPERGKSGSGKRTLAGFGYKPDSGATASMTAAGIACLAIAREALGPKLAAETGARVTREIQYGVHWLDHNFAVDKNAFGDQSYLHYWIYGLERVGSLLGIESLGAHMWFPEGARQLLRTQAADGAWNSPTGSPPPETDTCFAILFLERATRPTIVTGSHARAVAEAGEASEGVRLRARGTTEIAVWIDGFGAGTLEHWSAEARGGLRVAAVEYLIDGAVRASVAGDPARAWKDENFAAKLALDYPGSYELVARVRLAGGEPGAELRSAPLRVESEGRLAPWLTAVNDGRSGNLLLGQAPEVVESSVNGGDRGVCAFDGVESTRWMCKNDDPAPGIAVELPKALRGSRMLIYSHCNASWLAGKHDVIRRVSVRLNNSKGTIEVEAPADELQPIVVPLPKGLALQRFELKIVDRVRGTDWPGHAGFTEIVLEK